MIAIGILGAILRLIYFLHPKSLWFDEWASVSFSSESFRQTVVANIQDTHPPLYFLLLHASMKFLGPHEWAFRLPALAAGIGAVFIFYSLTKEWFGSQTARYAAFFFAISPFFIHLSQEIRNHGLPVLFCLVGTWAFSKNRKALFVLSSAAAVYTDHFTWFWLTALAVYAWFEKKFDRSFWALLATTLPAFILFAYHSLHGNEVMQYENLGTNYTVFTVLKQIVIVYWHFVTGYGFLMYWTSHVLQHMRSPVFWLEAIVGFWAGLYILRGLWDLFHKDRNKGFFFLMVAFGPILVVAAINPTRVETRYFSFAAPFIFMLIASGIRICLLPRIGRFFPMAWTLALMAANAQMTALPVDPLHREDYLAMTRYVAARVLSHDAVVANGNTIFRYYAECLALPFPAHFYLELDDIRPQEAATFNRIWYLDGLPVEGNDFPILKERMKKIGFIADGDELRFGGELDYAIVNRFKKEDPARSS